MDSSDFFSECDKLDFKSYISETHSEIALKKLSTLKRILWNYNDDIKRFKETANAEEKAKLRGIKTSFTVNVF
jgi:vacuolar-type H+-ATPase subunit E/Vma4